MGAELQGQVAIVTGASAGTGRGYALALAGAGATVIACARTLGKVGGEPARNTLAEVVRAGEGLPSRIYAQVCDLQVEADIVRMTEEVVANFGRIDILVNNAGVYPHFPTLGISVAEWDMNFGINVRAPYLMSRSVGPHMIRQGGGSIINITSLSAIFTSKGHPGHEDLLMYCVTKAALNRMTTFLAEDWKAHGVAVNSISPGFVETDTFAGIDPVAVANAKTGGYIKPPTPEALGPALIYLAQQRGDGITGQILHTDEFRKSWPAAA
jgi:2-deoxy-D-gluconate 3-dehydrogenase